MTPSPAPKPARLFNPHSTGRPESLSGAALAPFGRRLAAYAIDITMVMSTYQAVVGFIKAWIARAGVAEDVYHSAHVHVRLEFEETFKLLWVVWLILYFGLIVWRTNGYTLGKRLLRIRILSLTHPRITLWQSIERALGYGASMLEGGFGFFQFFMEPNRRCVHDRIAETIVARDYRSRQAPAQPQAPPAAT